MRNLGRGDTDAIRVAEEKDTLAFALGALGGFNPLAGTGASPESLEETRPAGVGFGAVVAAHDLLDGLAGFIGVVEGNGADIVVKNVGLDNSVEDVAADETEVAVNGCCGTAGEVPYFWLVVGETGVSVLEVGDGD